MRRITLLAAMVSITGAAVLFTPAPTAALTPCWSKCVSECPAFVPECFDCNQTGTFTCEEAQPGQCDGWQIVVICDRDA